MSIRPVQRLIKAKPTLEGAGVHLRRAFGFGNTSDFDPFLLLDDFRNDVPEDYLAGFPWHPHRGIETITYVLAGTVDHADSMGNKGSVGAAGEEEAAAGGADEPRVRVRVRGVGEVLQRVGAAGGADGGCGLARFIAGGAADGGGRPLAGAL